MNNKRIHGSKVILKKKRTELLFTECQWTRRRNDRIWKKQLYNHHQIIWAKIIQKFVGEQDIQTVSMYHPINYLLITKRRRCLSVEKSGSQNLNLVIKLSTTSNRTNWHYVQWECYNIWSPSNILAKKV